jgi:hypothetical protein
LQEPSKNLSIDSDNVYWSKAGNKYHAYADCYHIKGKALSQGSIKESWEQKGISELCKTCQKKAAASLVPSEVKEVIETE